MDDQTISSIVEELKPLLEGRVLGKIFQLSRVSLAIDFRGPDNRYLFLSVEPASPRLYMIRRRARDLEKQSQASSSFVYALRKRLGSAALQSITKDENDRIVRFSFAARDELGESRAPWLIAQLAGRAANLFLLDERGYVVDALRTPVGPGQEIGERYEPPPQTGTTRSRSGVEQGSFSSLSEAADHFYLELEARRAFEARATALRSKLHRAIAQRRKLSTHLSDDLARHGDADEHKRIGELLLANTTTARRSGSKVLITDYYTEGEPPLELEIEENLSLTEEATRRFARYTKARRARQEIEGRLHAIREELERLEAQETELEHIIASRDVEAILAFSGEAKGGQAKRPTARKKSAESIPGVRRYRSSDGYEILVGRGARDNDHLTFRVARPHDLWLHAADYPGSHVVVRNPTRKEIPHRTIVEAAQLAASFSQARRDAKVDVHYTQRKFLAKPKAAQPGLVRMSSFRTLTVEPREELERLSN